MKWRVHSLILTIITDWQILAKLTKERRPKWFEMKNETDEK